MVSHARRETLTGREPVLVTMKVRPRLWNLRARSVFRRLLPSLFAARERLGGRLVQYSVQHDHVHLVVEALDTVCLSRAMQGLAVRLARAINRIMRRKGRVFADRFHSRALRTPRQVRNALAYVLGNARKHGIRWAWRIFDPCSSAKSFDGWIVQPLPGDVPIVVVPPKTWLLAHGWRRAGGALDPNERPAAWDG